MAMSFMIFFPSRTRICFLILFVCMFFRLGITSSSGLRMSSHHYISVNVDQNIGASLSKVDQADHVYTKGMRMRMETVTETGEREESSEVESLKTTAGTGSSIPDCTHACEACYPCKRVMVSFKCSLAESCPIVYRCLCKGKYYHVPSS